VYCRGEGVGSWFEAIGNTATVCPRPA
jgi:hypothetical protein